MVFGIFKKSESKTFIENLKSIDILPKSYEKLNGIDSKNFKTLKEISNYTKVNINIINAIFLYNKKTLIWFQMFKPDYGLDYSYVDYKTNFYLEENEKSLHPIFILLMFESVYKELYSGVYQWEEEYNPEVKLNLALNRIGLPIELFEDNSLKKEVYFYAFRGKLHFFRRNYFKPKKKNHFRLKDEYIVADSNVSIIKYDYNGQILNTESKKIDNIMFDKKVNKYYDVRNYYEKLKERFDE